MLRTLIFVSGILCFLAGCDKSSDNRPQETLTGTWKYIQHYQSIGAGPIYTSTEAQNQSVNFGPDGTFASNVPQYKMWFHYEQIDSVHLRFSGTPLTTERFFFRIDSSKHTLRLSSADHICIEGCGDVFGR